MKIKGSRDKYYEVDIDELTCNCRDWTCRRHNFSKGDSKRLCKHLIEAIELNSIVELDKSLMQLPNPYNMNYNEVSLLCNKLRDNDCILKYSVCGDIYKKSSIITEFVPVVLETVYKISSHSVSEMLGNSYELIHEDSEKIYYKGPIPIVIILSGPDDFLFKSLAYDLDKDELIRLSSISIRKLNLKLTKYGFLNNENKIIDMKVYTTEDLCILLGIDSIS